MWGAAHTGRGPLINCSLRPALLISAAFPFMWLLAPAFIFSAGTRPAEPVRLGRAAPVPPGGTVLAGPRGGLAVWRPRLAPSWALSSCCSSLVSWCFQVPMARCRPLLAHASSPKVTFAPPCAVSCSKGFSETAGAQVCVWQPKAQSWGSRVREAA